MRIDFDFHTHKKVFPFTKEPVFKGKSLTRGRIPTLPTTPFIQNRTDQELYVNWDHTEDFTTRTFTSYPHTFDRVGHVLFKDIQVTTERDSLKIPYTLNLYTYERANSGWFVVRSGWKGRWNIRGIPWTLSIVDNLDGVIDGNDILFLTENASDSPLRINSPMPEMLCVDEAVFDLNCRFKSVGSEIHLEVTATQMQVPMGSLRIETEGCRFLRLQDKNRIVLLRNPQGYVSVPAGHYTIENCIPNLSDRKLWPEFVSSDLRVTVTKEDQALLRIGAPLKHSVNVRKTQNLLTLGYQCVGAGGELYQFSTIERRPEFKIFKGPIRIADGKIPFG